MDPITLLLVITTIISTIYMIVDVYFEWWNTKLLEEHMRREQEDKAPWDQ